MTRVSLRANAKQSRTFRIQGQFLVAPWGNASPGHMPVPLLRAFRSLVSGYSLSLRWYICKGRPCPSQTCSASCLTTISFNQISGDFRRRSSTRNSSHKKHQHWEPQLFNFIFLNCKVEALSDVSIFAEFQVLGRLV